MLSTGEAIWYIEYLDHARISNWEKFKDEPITLWCVGKIAQENDDFIAVICSGVKDRQPTSQPTYEIILKKAIIFKQLIYIVGGE
ncbi:MAG TPA: hypothetical protein ENI51_07935 [Candidatus Atribacteria bacterium]|nr:hypothetical protein [Candidatus Atribacteria bacterium]